MYLTNKRNGHNGGRGGVTQKKGEARLRKTSWQLLFASCTTSKALYAI